MNSPPASKPAAQHTFWGLPVRMPSLGEMAVVTGMSVLMGLLATVLPGKPVFLFAAGTFVGGALAMAGISVTTKKGLVLIVGLCVAVVALHRLFLGPVL